jgi:hypothetical protein
MLALFAGCPTLRIENQNLVPVTLLLTTLVAATSASVSPDRHQAPSWFTLRVVAHRRPESPLVTEPIESAARGHDQAVLPRAA